MKDHIANRIKQLHAEIDKSAANHNALLGQLAEARYMLNLCAEAELIKEAKAEYEEPAPIALGAKAA